MKVYIAGPMSGIELWNYPAFFAAAEVVKSYGHEPINPAAGETDMTKPWEWYIRRAVKLLVDADSVWMLPGWEASRGVHVERTLAMQLGMPIYELTDEGPILLHGGKSE